MTNEELRKILDPAIREANFIAWKAGMAEQRGLVGRLGPPPMHRFSVTVDKEKVTKFEAELYEARPMEMPSQSVDVEAELDPLTKAVLDEVFHRR